MSEASSNHPVPRLRLFTPWAINGPLEFDRRGAPLVAFGAAGFHGVVLHPRFCPNEPPYPSDDHRCIVPATTLRAKPPGRAFWIYDEDGWPRASRSTA